MQARPFDRFAPQCIMFGGPLIQLGLTLGDLALQICDNLVGIGYPALRRPAHFRTRSERHPKCNRTLIRVRLHGVLSPNPRIENVHEGTV